ncbi:N-acetylglucosamine-6-phosphate deacetylase [Pseudonocardia sp. ICBG1293]|uniref:N-acetylglucosamine-6-phosphate deacetylase n=1 Tax=Pseudonocardia sp. ICBG1293 TaxID=2844382 RepID=UPI001CCEE18C|nr:amidohydrolase family protein [Pseudonocardia sp. ICBG1293]
MSTARTVRGRDALTGRTIEITVEDGRVSAVRPWTPAPGTDPVLLAPGLVDLQVNGYAGYDVNGESVEPGEVRALVRALAAVGTTTVVPTVITASEAAITRALRAVARAIPYVHVEGPFIAVEDGPRGVHPADQVRPPDTAELERWQTACDGLVGMVTLSPHHPGTSAFVADATARGVLVAIGHTGASPEQIHAAADAGASLSTHLGNGAHALLPRHPNHLWAQLADDRLSAGFIADGHHLPPDTLRAMLRAKGPERSFLVSDSVALAGLPPGEYTTPVGGRVELSAEGRLAELGTPYLAGAARCLAECVATARRDAGLTLADALRLATASPGRFAGGRGLLVPGTPADLLRIADDPEHTTVVEVIADGEPVR